MTAVWAAAWSMFIRNFIQFIYIRTEGTEAWIDALGYMRHKQYIADKDGYRILKSKTIYVGKSPIRVRASRCCHKCAPPLEAIIIFYSIRRTSSQTEELIRNSIIHRRHQCHRFQMQSKTLVTVMNERKCPTYWCTTTPNQSMVDSHHPNIFRHRLQLHHQSQHIDRYRYSRRHR